MFGKTVQDYFFYMDFLGLGLYIFLLILTKVRLYLTGCHNKHWINVTGEIKFRIYFTYISLLSLYLSHCGKKCFIFSPLAVSADVIHTVGPIAQGGVGVEEKRALRSCYKNSLKTATENAARSVVRREGWEEGMMGMMEVVARKKQRGREERWRDTEVFVVVVERTKEWRNLRD